nr:Cna B-type domain-containing protein [Clostridia bacterium]
WMDCIINGEKQVAVLQDHEEFENSWTHSFQELIKTDKYRVIEERIVFADDSFVDASGITYDDLSDKGNGIIGNFATAATVAELSGAELADAKHWVATLTNSVPNRKIEVTKNWNDEDDRDKLRPERIYVTLQRDGINIDTVVLDATNSWTHEWGYLPLYKDGSAELSAYRIIETDVHGNSVSLNGYEVTYDVTKPGVEKTSITAGSFDLSGLNDGQTAEITVTNIHRPAKTTAYAGKKWDDGKNKYGERTDTIYLALFYKYQHEQEDAWRLIDKKALDAESLQYTDSLIHTTSEPVQKITGQSMTDEYWENVAKWENLPSQAVVIESGAKVIRIPEYRVVEVKGALSGGAMLSVALGSDITKVISGYKTTQPDAFFVHGEDSLDHIVTNKLEPVLLHIVKKWDDQNNRFANRPLRIDFAIQKKKGADGEWELLTETVEGKTVEKIVSVYPEMLGYDADTWTTTVDGLLQYAADGEEFSYRAVEISLAYADKTVDVFDKNDSSESLVTAIGNGRNGYATQEEEGEPIKDAAIDRAEYSSTIKNTQDKSAKV